MASRSLCLENVHMLCCSYLTLTEGTCFIKGNLCDTMAFGHLVLKIYLGLTQRLLTALMSLRDRRCYLIDSTNKCIA